MPFVISFSQELHNEVFSGQTPNATASTIYDEAKKGGKEKEMEEEEGMEAEKVLEKLRLLLVEVRQKEEEGAR